MKGGGGNGAGKAEMTKETPTGVDSDSATLTVQGGMRTLLAGAVVPAWGKTRTASAGVQTRRSSRLPTPYLSFLVDQLQVVGLHQVYCSM